MAEEALAAEFLARLARSDAWSGDPAALEQRLRALVEDAQRVRGAVTLDPLRFVGYVAERLPAEGVATDLLATLHAADLYLACACAEGQDAAIEELDRRLSALPRWLAQLRESAAFLDEIGQRLRERLLVRTSEEAPRIAEYAGRGPLDGFLRVVALRTALNLREQELKHRPSVDEPDEGALLGMAEPELAYLKARYRGELEQAFKEALASLTAEQRNVLRFHVVDGLNIAEIGKTLGVHRATIARWISECRAELLAGTRRRLRDRLGLSASELDSMIRLLRSQIDVSLGEFLRK